MSETDQKEKKGKYNFFQKLYFLGTHPGKKLREGLEYLDDYLKDTKAIIPFNPKLLRIFITAVIISAGFTYYISAHTSLNREAGMMAGIFVLACLLWITEALPLFATALLIMGLEIILLSNPGNWPGIGFETNTPPDYSYFLSPISDPVIILFLGGFILAKAAAKRKVDGSLAAYILKFFGSSPKKVLLGLMVTTVCFSMWISNTATTTMMITLALPILARIKDAGNFRKAVLISIPVAANIGGMSTPISSPPNALAISILGSNGIHFPFWQWMLVALPFVGLLLFIAYHLVCKIFPITGVNQKIEFEPLPISPSGRFVMVVFFITVIMWLTEPLHGLPTAVVALLPLIAFTASGQLNFKDINNLDWSVLLLIAGGIALGRGVSISGLDQAITGLLPVGGSEIIIALCVVTLLMGTLISNTATVNLIMPIAVSIAYGFGDNSPYYLKEFCIALALVSSLGMALPVSTPSNSIAYAQGELENKDFLKIGGLIGLIGLVVILGAVYLLRYI